MKFLVPFLLFFAFVACSDEKKEVPSIDTEQNVSIEQSDEKTEVNDTNVPLPVPNSHLQPYLAPNTATYALASHQGGGGVKKNDRELSVFLGFAPL